MMNSVLTFIVNFITLGLLCAALYFTIEEATHYTGPEKLWEKSSWVKPQK